MYTVILYRDDLIVTKKLHNYKYCLFLYKKMHDLVYEHRATYNEIDYRRAMKSCAVYILELLIEARAIETYTNDKIQHFEDLLSECEYNNKIENDEIKKVTYKLQRFVEEYQEYIRCYFRCISLKDFERAEAVNDKGKQIISRIKHFQNKYVDIINNYIESLPCRHSFAKLENQEHGTKIYDCFSHFMSLRYYATESFVKIDILLSIAKAKLSAFRDNNFDLIIELENKELMYFEENIFFGEDHVEKKQQIISKFEMPSFDLGFRSNDDENGPEVVIQPLCYGCTHESPDVINHTGLCKVTCDTCLKGIHRKHSGQCLPRIKKIHKSVNMLLETYDIKDLTKYFDEDIRVAVSDSDCRFNTLSKELLFVLQFFIDKKIILNS
ncbi:MAG: hypothetical protein CMB64_05030 [Euryarchaeota archaeon]|nr:hypothetical protein [Euryarchaeota archaeon]